jgi:hypothetical protein
MGGHTIIAIILVNLSVRQGELFETPGNINLTPRIPVVLLLRAAPSVKIICEDDLPAAAAAGDEMIVFLSVFFRLGPEEPHS